MLKAVLRNLVGHVSFWALVGAAGAAAAQEPSIIERITVTAEKRAADVQKVPIAMTALTGNQLDERGVEGFEDLKFQVPSLTFGGQVTGGENFITLRGVGNENLTGGGDPGVSYHVDGVYLGRTVSVDETFFDVERVEVLRGPQGTLYGRNSTGGAINVITRRPVFEFEGSTDVTYGTENRWTVRSMLNVPLAEDRAALRIAGVVNAREGYQENLLPASVCGDCEGDAADNFGVRAQVLLQLSEDADLILAVSHYESNEPVATKIREPFPPMGPGGFGRYFGALPNPADLRKIRKDFNDFVDMRANSFSATLEWEAWDGIALTSITGYQSLYWNQGTDGDGSELPIAFTNYWRNDSWQVSEEFRIASTGEGPASWIAGLFLYRETVRQGFQFVDTGLNFLGPGPLGIDLFTFTNGGTINTHSLAGFGQYDYTFEEGLFDLPTTFSLGLRYTHDVKDGNDFLEFVFFGSCVPFGLCASKAFEDSWDTITGRFGIQLQSSEDVMWYANVSRGYRSGGVLVGNFPGNYNPEYIWAYEAGVKSTLWDGRLQLNVAAFHNDYDDIQVFIQDIAGSRIENAAKATIDGVELDAIVAVTDALTLNAGFAWLDATYDEYVTIDSRFEGSGLPEDLSGNRLNRTPEFTVLLGAAYEVPTDIGPITFRVDFMWQDEVFFRAQNLPQDRQESFTKTDLRIRWTDSDERYSIEAFAENLEDEDVVNNLVLPAQTLGGPSSQVTLNPPRIFGVRLGVSY